MLNLFRSNILIVFMVLVSSCSDLYSSKVNEVSSGQFATCDFDSGAISEILTKNIKGELSCLNTNLLFFVDIVETDMPGSLSEKELKAYIRKNLEQIDESTISALSSIFDLSRIIFGDKKGYIKKANVNSLFNLLKEINVLFVDNNIHEYFTTKERISFFEHGRRKAVIFNTLRKVGDSLTSKMISNNHVVDLDAFIDHFNGVAGDGELLKKAKSVLFIKKVILGGKKSEMSFHDLKRLSVTLKDLSKVVYDFTNILDVDVDPADDEEVANILKEDAETVIKNFFYRNNPNEQIITLSEIKDIFDVFAPHYSKHFKYEKSILKVKEIFFGSNSQVFKAADFTFLFDSILGENLERSVVFYKAFRENQHLIETEYSINSDLNNITTIGFAQERYKDDFNRILKDYRIFKGTREIPLVDFKYDRNMRSLVEIAFYEDITNRVFKYYGQAHKSNKGLYTINLEQLNTILKDFSTPLYDKEVIYEGRLASTADTIALMTSLFHPQSNGDSAIEVPEMVEFVVTLLGSLNLSETLTKNIGKYCKVSRDGKYNSQCFRDNFRSLIRNYREEGSPETIADSLPILDSYLNSLSNANYQEYMKKTATFSRTCSTFPSDGSEVPMEEGDGLVTWVGLLAIEQSIIKYDTDRDGVLSSDELEALYITFKPALEAMIPDTPRDYLKKKSWYVFKYIIKYKKVPTFDGIKGPKSLWRAMKAGGHFAIFLYNPWAKRDADADRMTFASVLQIIAENTPENGTPFDCETLRN